MKVPVPILYARRPPPTSPSPWPPRPPRARDGRRARPTADTEEQWGDKPQAREVFLRPKASHVSACEAVALGHSILVVDRFATPAECEAIRVGASEAAAREREARCLSGLVRKPIGELLDSKDVERCDVLFLRQMACLQAALPELLLALFGEGCLSQSSFTGNHHLVFSQDEPALNVYTPRTALLLYRPRASRARAHAWCTSARGIPVRYSTYAQLCIVSLPLRLRP